MSRIGKQPVTIPAGVKVEVSGQVVKVEGAKGQKLEMTAHPRIKVRLDAGKSVVIERPDNERFSRSLHGLTRSLINNMVVGVTKGYEKRLLVVGVGYTAQMDGKVVVLTVGYAKPVRLPVPEGVTAEVAPPPLKVVENTNSLIIIRGADKQKVGQFAAELRAARKPEPYKGKGVRYENEQVRHKEGKSFTSGG